jgi:predicted transcriptional regulator
MVKTTLYLPDELKHDVERTARERGLSEAEFLRQAIQAAVEPTETPEPEVGFITIGEGTTDYASRIDQELAESGFGEW